MKLAIFTIALGNDPSYLFTIDTFRLYAKKVGAELIVLTKPVFKLPGKKISLEYQALIQKLYIDQLLEKFERVLYIDADILINPEAPNIFAEYPDDHYFYMFNEGAYEKRNPVIEQIRQCFHYDGPWINNDPSLYYNAGVILCSQKANLVKQASLKDLRIITDNKVGFYEQTYFNYLIAKYTLPIKELSPLYNRMSLLGKGEKRFEAYFIHHAGNGYATRRMRRYQLIYNDYRKLYQKDIHFLKKLQFIYQIICWRITRIINRQKRELQKILKPSS